MSGSKYPVSILRDRRLSAHALSASPAWVWSKDGTTVLWANPAGAAALELNPAAAATLRLDGSNPIAMQIARIADALPDNGAPRLERVRGFAAGIGALLTCQCSRFSLAGVDAVFMLSMERAARPPPEDARLGAVVSGLAEAVAAFTATGELLQSSPNAQTYLAGATTVSALGADTLAQTALNDGDAEGDVASARAVMVRLDGESGPVLLAAFTAKTLSDTAAPDSQAQPPSHPPRQRKRRNTLRFIWQSDASGRFTIETEDFLQLTGGKTAELSGRDWSEIAVALNLDPAGDVAKALDSRTTWSAIPLQWPAANGEPIAVELAGQPVFDHDRVFQGYRGFGLCRDIARFQDSTPSARPLPPTPANPNAATAEHTEPAPAAPGSTVVPFPSPILSPVEQRAFHEIARELGDRLKETAGKPLIDDDFGPERPDLAGDGVVDDRPAEPRPQMAADASADRPILDRLPIGVLVYRYDSLIYANRALLDWTGDETLDALAGAGGLDGLFIEPAAGSDSVTNGNGAKTLTIAARDGNQKPVEGRLFSVTWGGDSALVLMINTLAVEAGDNGSDKSAELARREIDAENQNLKAAIDTATDGVLLLNAEGRVLFANSSAAALFGRERDDLAAATFGDLFAPESRRTALDYLDRLARDQTAGIINPGKDLIARAAQGGLIPLHLTIGRIGIDGEEFCAVLRDITALKKAEEDLVNARQKAEASLTEKSEFLAKISHDIRTPLNAILGFSEVMMEQRFGAVGNERYRQYIRDIHTSGKQLISLLNDLLDLAKIETGKLDLNLTQVDINDITQQCVAALQPQANRERVIIRSSLPLNLPPIVADARSVRQIVLNLLANSIKFTGAGGQVIVSTAQNDANEVVLRVRDTGAGLGDRELLSALEPFRHLATTARWGANGTGLDLPITKALAEANRATFSITSGADRGTLVEVAFPATRVVA